MLPSYALLKKGFHSKSSEIIPFIHNPLKMIILHTELRQMLLYQEKYSNFTHFENSSSDPQVYRLCSIYICVVE